MKRFSSICVGGLLASVFLMGCGDDAGPSGGDAGSRDATVGDADAASEDGGLTPAAILHAAPDGGGDACSEEAPCTLWTAQTRVRERTRGMKGDIIVELGGGTYVLDRSWVLSPDAGDSGTGGFAVIYQARGFGTDTVETPVLSGGRTITGWTLEDSDRNVWRAEVAGLETRQIFVDGVRARRTRQRSGLPAAVTQTATGYVTTSSEPRTWANPSDVELIWQNGDGTGNWLWAEPRCPIASITETGATTTITMASPCFSSVLEPRGQKVMIPTAIENLASSLVEPGTFYLDRATPGAHVLRYIPRPGEDLTQSEVIAAVIERLVDGQGTSANPIHHVHFRGLTFSHATWLEPNTPTGFSEFAYNTFGRAGMPVGLALGNVTFFAGQDLVFEGNTFVHLGGVGLHLDYGSQRNLVRGNVFRDISSHGIQIGNLNPEMPLVTDNVIDNNYVHDVAVEYPGAYGLWNANTQRTTVSHNVFAHLPRGGIASTYSYNKRPPNIANGHRFTDNLVFDYMKVMHDGGGFDTNGTQNGPDGNQPGTLVAGNVFRDDHNPYGQIYLDFGASGFTIENNVAYDSDSLDFNTIESSDQFCCTTLRYNFFEQDNSFKFRPNADMAEATHVLPPTAMPASILLNAGLEPAYQHLMPEEPRSDIVAPVAPGVPIASAITAGPSVTISWQPASDDVGVTGYEIDHGDLVVAAVTGDQTSATVVGLRPGTTYELVVRARDAAGNLSPASAPLVVVVPGEPDLVGHWTFDEGGADASGGANAADVTNIPTVTGPRNAAIELAGAPHHVLIGHRSLFNHDRSSFSVALWLRTTTSGWQRLVTKGNFGNTPGYLLQSDHGGIAFGLGSNFGTADSTLFATPKTFADGAWHHVAAVVDRAERTIRIYVDGEAQPLTTAPAFCGTASGSTGSFAACPLVVASSTDPLSIGSYNGIAEFFVGGLDDVRIYSRALSAADVAALVAP